MHYYKTSNEIMQYCIVSNDIALIMHYRALLKRSGINDGVSRVSLDLVQSPIHQFFFYVVLKKHC